MTDVMRKTYRPLTNEEAAQMTTIKTYGEDFVTYCESLGVSRELSLAKTKMEEAVMWAVKHLTK
jgi:hypothetical protein